MFEVAVGRKGLKYLRIDAPPAAAELMNEQRRNRAEFKIGGVEVGALLRYRGLAFLPMRALLADRDLALLLDALRFDHPHQAVRNGPIDFRQVPPAKFPIDLHVNPQREGRRRSAWPPPAVPADFL